MTAPIIGEGKNPYVGPRTFAYEDRHVFFGREREARNLLARVVSERLLLFCAQSGAGKSSLINTQLLPSLREEEDFNVLPVGRVGGDLPLGLDVDNPYVFNLMISLAQNGAPVDLLAGLTISDFLAQLVSDDGEAWRYEPVVQRETNDKPARTNDATTQERFVLVIDQFEEIITSHPGYWPERENFFRQLDQALSNHPNLWVVLTLREDYVAALDPYAPLMFNRLRARFYMERMGAAAALDAICRPAELGGRPFAAGVAEQLLDNLRLVRSFGQDGLVVGEHVEPVQLQVVCYQLWENIKYHSPGPINADDLQEAGDVDRALVQFYRETLAFTLTDVPILLTERRLRDWFDNELITSAGTRGLVRQDRDTTGSLPNAVVVRLQKRFLVHAETRSGNTWIELVHDRFVEPIRDDNQAWRAEHLTIFQRQAALWEERNRPSGFILSGEALAEAEHLAAQSEYLEPHEKEFLIVCQQAQMVALRERQQNRRIRMLAVVASVVAVVAILAAVISVIFFRDARVKETEAQRQTRLARAGELAAQSQAVAQRDPELGIILALEALTQTMSFDEPASIVAQEALQNALNGYAGPVLSDHSGPIHDAAISQDSRWLVTGGWDGEIRVWDLAHPENEPVKLSAHAPSVRAVSITPDGRWLVSGGEDNAIRFWNLRDLAQPPIQRTLHQGPVTTIAISRDSHWVATGSEDASVQLIRITNDPAHPIGYTIPLEGHQKSVTSLAFDRDSHWLASGSQDATIRLWDVTAWDVSTPVDTLSGHSAGITDLEITSDGRWLASASRDDTVRLWRLDNADPARDPVVLRGHTDSIMDIAITPDSRQLVSVSLDGIALLWDLSATDPAASSHPLYDGYEAGVTAVTVSPSGRWVVTGANNNTARLFDLASDSPGPTSFVMRGHIGAMSGILVSPDERWIVTFSADRTARLWNLLSTSQSTSLAFRAHSRSLTTVATVPGNQWFVTGSADYTARLWRMNDTTPSTSVELQGHTGRINALAVSGDGHWLGTASSDGTARLWDLTASDPTTSSFVLTGHTGSVNRIIISPDHHWVVTGASDGSVRFWDLQASDPARDPIIHPVHTGAITVLIMSPDGNWLVSAGVDKRLWLWDLSSGVHAVKRIALEGHIEVVTAAAISPDSYRLATGSLDGMIHVWSLSEPGKLIAPLTGHKGAIRSLAFSSDGKWLASGSSDHSVRLWNETPTNQWLIARPLDIDAGEVAQVVFSPDTHWLVTVSSDYVVRVWDLTSQPPASSSMSFLGHEGRIMQVAITSDSRYVLTAGSDTTARLWHLDAQELYSFACQVVGRNLPQQEWERYFAGQTYRPTCPDLLNESAKQHRPDRNWSEHDS